jgi:excisionase family DNA binding protein
MERYFKTFELAYELGVSQQTVSRWLNSGKLEFVQLSTRRRVIPESAIQKFLDAKIIRPPQKLLDPGSRPAKHSGHCSLKTEDTGRMNAGETSYSQLRMEVKKLCRSH